jgi:hypothetical protein
MAMSQSGLDPGLGTGASMMVPGGGESLLMSNLQEGEADVVRELIRMLDAVYTGNRL